jgi:hypothetical protein
MADWDDESTGHDEAKRPKQRQHEKALYTRTDKMNLDRPKNENIIILPTRSETRQYQDRTHKSKTRRAQAKSYAKNQTKRVHFVSSSRSRGGIERGRDRARVEDGDDGADRKLRLLLEMAFLLKMAFVASWLNFCARRVGNFIKRLSTMRTSVA